MTKKLVIPKREGGPPFGKNSQILPYFLNCLQSHTESVPHPGCHPSSSCVKRQHCSRFQVSHLYICLNLSAFYPCHSHVPNKALKLASLQDAPYFWSAAHLCFIFDDILINCSTFSAWPAFEHFLGWSLTTWARLPWTCLQGIIKKIVYDADVFLCDFEFKFGHAYKEL